MEVPVEMSEEEILKKIDERIANYKRGNSKDGFIQTWRKEFVYMGIPYELAILKYFTHVKGLDCGINRLGKHAVLEHSSKMKEVARIMNDFDAGDEFLFQDTLHSFQREWELKAMLNYLEEEAHKQIKQLFMEARSNEKLIKALVKISSNQELKENLIKIMGIDKYNYVKREVVAEEV